MDIQRAAADMDRARKENDFSKRQTKTKAATAYHFHSTCTWGLQYCFDSNSFLSIECCVCIKSNQDSYRSGGYYQNVGRGEWGDHDGSRKNSLVTSSNIHFFIVFTSNLKFLWICSCQNEYRLPPTILCSCPTAMRFPRLWSALATFWKYSGLLTESISQVNMICSPAHQFKTNRDTPLQLNRGS